VVVVATTEYAVAAALAGDLYRLFQQSTSKANMDQKEDTTATHIFIGKNYHGIIGNELHASIHPDHQSNMLIVVAILAWRERSDITLETFECASDIMWLRISSSNETTLE
jgi:hypothetical protein